MVFKKSLTVVNEKLCYIPLPIEGLSSKAVDIKDEISLYLLTSKQ